MVKTFKIINLATFFRIVDRFDEGTAGTARISSDILSGDLFNNPDIIGRILQLLREGFASILSADTIGDIVKMLLADGAIEIATGWLDVQRPGVTIKNVRFVL